MWTSAKAELPPTRISPPTVGGPMLTFILKTDDGCIRFESSHESI
jgi:hypothetical protein